jgi:carotenoid cleavage dioxygenase-like enzyme
MDFPHVHPQRDGLEVPAVYAATRTDRTKSDPFDAVARVDLADPDRPTEIWSAAEHQFVGEPVFAPRPGGAGPDDGWVIALVYDGLAERTHVCVLDAACVSAGPVAAVPLPLQPYGFYGTWDAGPLSGYPPSRYNTPVRRTISCERFLSCSRCCVTPVRRPPRPATNRSA